MNIKIANSAGFCFGVDRAVKEVYDTLRQTSAQVYTFGDIIHNAHVVNDLKDKGVKVIKNLKEVPDPNAHIIIRAHGVGTSIYKEIQEKGFKFSDATCPYVKKIHKLVDEKYKRNFNIIIVGDPNHPEVKGINGWCDNSASIISDITDAQQFSPKEGPACLVAQTTLPRRKWEDIVKLITQKNKNIQVFNTICNATSERQIEAARIAKEVDSMVVIGDKGSSNTQKLYEICRENCGQTYFVESVADVPKTFNLYKNDDDYVIGITAGASTPAWMINQIVEFIKS